MYDEIPVTIGYMVLIIFANASTDNATTNKSVLEILLIGGVPLNEPVVRYGPFVMNTKEEILQAVEDYRNGKMGEITAQ
jgi:quercetin 2,3-dioxygenase